ncbi:MAG: hypothetical protein A2806_01240 [Candidatus Terrybacteria bacterium RIFCSPHIGHO2_01_FULL_48_17]|uniref:Uncharacterized protein n=1 Tax=Candidatus Terrybacteria bacterium RIFCSPHIGHO2_01_FULL_48_17 TaxID=1802362 RepID=A0A1G2PM92_9BACT|nr:MAG: hypothetical protein A2806_01240 [Candidatus Terrybacteria bacterium RIFCSPHIGHO2_01_FULL_48_17]OHA53409.1 MAG: hypothetical protein A3A30_02710 [Candidatus Terrybacteria bacterium RIFCSPLOWO2_01_FULL_48_14]
MFFLAAAFLLLGLLFFGAVSAAIVYHIKKYAVQGDRSRQLLVLFLVGTIVWAILILASFLATPWSSLPELLQQ